MTIITLMRVIAGMLYQTALVLVYSKRCVTLFGVWGQCGLWIMEVQLFICHHCGNRPNALWFKHETNYCKGICRLIFLDIIQVMHAFVGLCSLQYEDEEAYCNLQSSYYHFLTSLLILQSKWIHVYTTENSSVEM